MRPLPHPSLDDVTLEGILHALSDEVRVAIFAGIAGSGVFAALLGLLERQPEGRAEIDPVAAFQGAAGGWPD